MHIFNLDNRPHLIISSNDILFRHDPLDEQMQRHSFEEIKKISVIHRYSPSKELFVWLNIQTHKQNTPYLVQLSSLNEPLEKVMDILKAELKGKVKISLPKSTYIPRLRTGFKTQKRLAFLSVFLLLGLLAYHKLVIPSTVSLAATAIKVSHQKPQGICSANLKVAFPSNTSQHTKIKDYCALFGFWKLESTKEIPSKYIDTEFSDYTAKQWLLGSKKMFNEKKYDNAIEEAQKALYLEPENALAQVFLSKIHAINKEHTKALALAKQTILKHPKVALAHENIANLYKEEDNISQAYIYYQSYNRLSPDANSYTLLANIEKDQGLEEKALLNYEKSLVFDPNNPYVLTQLGLSYWKHKKFMKAHDSLKKAYDLFPDEPGYFLNYYEISLVTTNDVNTTQKDNFLNNFGNDKEKVMVFEMLNIIQMSINKEETQGAKDTWSKNFQDIKLDWSFQEIRSWLAQSDLEPEHQQEVQATLGFFIGYQQIYNLEHSETLEMETL